MFACSEINDAMQKINETTYATCDHVKSSKARQQKDHRDTYNVIYFLLDKNPFGCDRVSKILSSDMVSYDTL